MKSRRLWLTMLGVICFASLIWLGGFGEFEKISEPDWRWLVASIFGTGGMIYLFSFRWGLVTNNLEKRRVTSSLQYFFYSLSSLALGTFFPHSASTIIGKAAALNRLENVSLKKSAAAVLLDKLFDGWFMLLLAWPFSLLFLEIATVEQVVSIVAGEFLIISIGLVRYYTFWINLLKSLLTAGVSLMSMVPILKKIKNWQKIGDLQRLDLLNLLSRKTVLNAYWLTALGVVMMAVRAWFAAMIIGIDITPYEMFVGIGLVQASILVSVTPGALGFADAAWFVALSTVGVEKEEIAVYLITLRLVESLAIMIWWLPLYLLNLQKSTKDHQKN